MAMVVAGVPAVAVVTGDVATVAIGGDVAGVLFSWTATKETFLLLISLALLTVAAGLGAVVNMALIALCDGLFA